MGFSLDFICYFGENYVFYCDFRWKITFFWSLWSLFYMICIIKVYHNMIRIVLFCVNSCKNVMNLCPNLLA